MLVDSSEMHRCGSTEHLMPPLGQPHLGPATIRFALVTVDEARLLESIGEAGGGRPAEEQTIGQLVHAKDPTTLVKLKEGVIPGQG